MATRTETTSRRRALAELQGWYLGGLAPKLAAAANAGKVEPFAVAALDRDVRRLLELAGQPHEEAA